MLETLFYIFYNMPRDTLQALTLTVTLNLTLTLSLALTLTLALALTLTLTLTPNLTLTLALALTLTGLRRDGALQPRLAIPQGPQAVVHAREPPGLAGGAEGAVHLLRHPGLEEEGLP